MNPYIEEILNRIQDLLALSPPVSISRAPLRLCVTALFLIVEGVGGRCVQSLLRSVCQLVLITSTAAVEGSWQCGGCPDSSVLLNAGLQT
jgi:hypothetical protein